MEIFTPKPVGARIKRHEDERLLTGRGAYVDDSTPAGLLHAAFLRNPYAHARITETDTTAARAMDGVIGQHTDAIMQDVLGYAPEEMARLKETKVLH